MALVGHGHALRVLASVFLEQDPCFGAQLILDAGSVSVLGHEHGVRPSRAGTAPRPDPPRQTQLPLALDHSSCTV